MLTKPQFSKRRTDEGKPLPRVPPGPAPRLIRLRLDQIESDVDDGHFSWLSKLRHTPKSVPSLTPAALALLELTQPLLVSPKMVGEGIHLKDLTYRLEAGLRTFQLLLEQRPRTARVWAISVPRVPAGDRRRYRAFDSIVSKLIRRPDGSDLTLLGAVLLEDRELREAVGAFVEVGSDGAIANLLGMSRSTLHRQTGPYRKLASEEAQASNEKVSLDIDPETEDDVK